MEVVLLLRSSAVSDRTFTTEKAAHVWKPSAVFMMSCYQIRGQRGSQGMVYMADGTAAILQGMPAHHFLAYTPLTCPSFQGHGRRRMARRVAPTVGPSCCVSTMRVCVCVGQDTVHRTGHSASDAAAQLVRVQALAQASQDTARRTALRRTLFRMQHRLVR